MEFRYVPVEYVIEGEVNKGDLLFVQLPAEADTPAFCCLELRRVLDAAGKLGQSYVHEWLKLQRRRHAVTWRSLFTMIGMDPPHCIVPSLRQVAECARLGQEAPPYHHYAMSEIHITIAGALGLLLLWCGQPRGQRCSMVLQSLLRVCLREADVHELLTRIGADPMWRQCTRAGHDQQQMCACICERVNVVDLSDVLDHTAATLRLVQVMTAIVQVGTACPAVTSIIPHLHQDLCARVVTGCLRCGHVDSVKAQGTADPSGAKRRKIDANALSSLTSASSEQHISLGKLLVHHDLADRSLANRHYHNIVATSLAAGWAALSGGLMYGVALDGKRLGNPAEELLASVIVQADSGRASFGPFQVPRVSDTIRRCCNYTSRSIPQR
eukprot:4777386-Amphidinium_carterae.2